MAQPIVLAAEDSRRRVALLAGALAGCFVISIAGRGVLVRVSELFPTSLPDNPYFVPGQALLLYVALPVVVLATIAAQLAPGILAVAATGGSARAGDFVLKAFAGAYTLRTVSHALVKLAGVDIGLGAYTAVEVTLLLVLTVLAVRRAGRGPIALPVEPAQRRRVLWMAAIPALTVVMLLPVIFWQDFTDDGLEALEIGWSLMNHVVPRFPNASGLMGLGVGMLAMAPAVHWFAVLLGPFEAAARLPLVLYLPVLYGVLIELIEWQAPRPMTARHEGILTVALATYVVTMAYSASYTPYSADVAAPAAFETLTMTCLSAVILFLWQERRGWLLFFVLLSYLARPNGLLLLLLLVVSTWVAVPQLRRAWLRELLLAIGACVVMMLVYEKIVIPVLSAGGAPGYPSESIKGRIQYLNFTDWRRVLYAAMPAGLLPFLALAAWKKQDPLTRQVALVAALYFLFFYPQAFISLHHFVPAMILPLVVFWRMALRSAARWLVPAAAVLAAVCFWLSLPPRFRVERTFRALGRATDVRVGNHFGTWEEYRASIMPRNALDSLFGQEWLVKDASRELVGVPLALIYYSDRPGPRDSVPNYIVQRDSAAAPEGYTSISSLRGFTTYVRDRQRWQRDRTTPPPTDFRSPLYVVRRETLYRFLGIPAHNYQINLADLPGMWRVF